jgi:hypothetical protein
VSASDTPRTDAALAATYEETGTLCATHRHLTELCRQLERELAAAQRDAERYRWLRVKHNDGDQNWFVYGAGGLDNLDEDIDAAMAKESK